MGSRHPGHSGSEGEAHGSQPAEQPDGTERTIGQLVADATHDVSTIVRSEIALAKAEVAADAKKAGAGAGMFAAAAFVALLG